jgi:hypothetical protein
MSGEGALEEAPPAANLNGPDRFTPADMADLIVSGWSGGELERRLWAYFPKARRGEVYIAISVAAALFKADLAIAELEAEILRRQLREAGQEPAA